MPAHGAAELKRDAISLGKLQIRDQVRGFSCQEQCAGISSAVEIREARKVGALLRDDDIRCCVGLEELGFVILIERHQRCHESGDSRLPAERSVLCLRQLEPRLQADRRRCHTHGAKGISGGGSDCRLHGCGHYSMILTKI